MSKPKKPKVDALDAIAAALRAALPGIPIVRGPDVPAPAVESASRFKIEPHFERLGGGVYIIDASLVPALRHVPRELLPPLIVALDREFRARHKAWMLGIERRSRWRARWMDQAIPLVHRGLTYANIGKHLESKGLGSADRIARTLAEVVKNNPRTRIKAHRKK